MIPYGRQWIEDDDIEAVVQVLRGDWLTTGPAVTGFEEAVAARAGAKHAVAVSSGTAALHAAMAAIGIGPGDEVIVPAITFAASSNCVAYVGGTPIFADVDAASLLLDPVSVAAKITPRTRAIVAVDYAGQPCDYAALRALAKEHGLVLVADACHSIGGSDGGTAVGSLADLTSFSFHPVKHITTGEGGMLVTNDDTWAARARQFRNHGINTDHRQRQTAGTFAYEMQSLGYNYRITDIQCALGASQLAKLDGWIARRNAIATQYDAAFGGLRGITPLSVRPGVVHAYHLYVIRVDAAVAGLDREEAYAQLRAAGIGVNVHYLPVYLHPWYRETYGYGPGLCPVAEAAYPEIISLPMYPKMTDDEVATVIAAVSALTPVSEATP